MATGIGETLRTARRQQGRSLADAAAQTRVRETYLAALEEEEFAALGGDVYVKGFLRSYARFLGLDPAPLIAAYRDEHERDHLDELAPLTQTTIPVTLERRRGVVLLVGAVIAILALLAYIGLRAGDGDPSSSVTPPPSPAAERTAGAPADVPDDGGEPDDGAEPDADPEAPALEGVEVTVTVTAGSSWLRVVVDGERLLEDLRSAGFTELFRGEREIVVRVGDAGVVQVVANGEDQGALGRTGQVVQLTCPAGAVVCDREEIT